MVAEEVARLLPAAVLAQLEAVVDDPDNVCCVCEELIAGPSANVAVFAEDKFAHVNLAHPACMTSGVRSAPGLDRCMAQACTRPRESEMATLLGLRDSSPRALLFLEPSLTVCSWDGDPLGTFAVGLGLSPVSGAINRIAPPPTDLLSIQRREDGLALLNQFGTDSAPASRSELDQWWAAADGQALVIVARGLGLSRTEPAIEEALQFRPAWGAMASLDDSSSPPSRQADPQLPRRWLQALQRSRARASESRAA